MSIKHSLYIPTQPSKAVFGTVYYILPMNAVCSIYYILLFIVVCSMKL